jgi:hypothetical protein
LSVGQFEPCDATTERGETLDHLLDLGDAADEVTTDG